MKDERAELPPNRQTPCLTAARWEYEEEEEKQVEAALSPEDFRVWMIQKREHLYQMGLKAFGTPLPEELTWSKVVLPPELAHVSADKIFMMTKKNEFKVIVLPQE
jgi:hypothetical protein